MLRRNINYRLKKLLIPFLILWTMPAFAQKQHLPSNIVFSGRIINTDSNKKLSFKFYDNFLTFEEIIYPAPIKNDTFRISIPFKENTSGFIVYGDSHVPIFVEKGDSIYIKSDAKFFIDSLEYSGRGGLKNNYLKRTFLKFDVNDANYIDKGISNNTANNYQLLLSNYKAEKVAFMDEFLTERDTHFSTPFYDYIKADINYWWGQNLMRYRAQHPTSKIFKIPLSLEKEYYEFMDVLDLNNEANLNNANYREYISQYTDWREDMITRGKLKFKNSGGTKKELLKVKMERTFGQVLIDQLKVRKEAHDELSAFAKLNRGEEVLFLQDVTNDKFMYGYNGKRYRDKFLKIELPDGSVGWVFNGGIHLKQKVGYVKKWIEVPDTRPELMQNFKFANFKGKVMKYAIAKDVIKEISKKGVINKKKIEDYLAQAKDSPYLKILKREYENIKAQEIIKNSRKGELTKASENKNEIVIADETLKRILEQLTSAVAKNLIKKEKENSYQKHNQKEIITAVAIPAPDFSTFSRMTRIDAKTSINTRNKAEIIINTNPILREETVFPFPKISNASLHLNVPLRSTTTASVKLGNQEIDIYLQPGYDMTIQIKGNDLYNGLVFSGKGSGINNYLVAASKIFKHTNKELEDKIREANIEKFKTYLKALKEDKVKFLKEYLETHALSTEVVKYAKADIEYWYAYNLMNYPFEHPIIHNQPSPMEVPSDYYEFMGKVALNNSVAIPNKYYLYYIQDYLSFVAGLSENKNLSRFDLADKYLKGKSLYYYKALQHSIALKRNSLPDAEKAASQFIWNCPYKLYGEYVKLAYQESRGIVEGIDAPNFELVDKDGSIVSIADFKGKVVFLDFWATWCRPCTRLIPAHQNLQEQFKNDNVVFLYVSMDKNANQWRDYLTNSSFTGKHLLADTEMVEKYKVETIPYSILIDADGKIVWQHTGGFSIQETVRRILGLLQ